MGPDTPLPTGPNPFSALTLSPVETRKDAIVVLRRDSASSRGSSQNTSATPTNSSPRTSANPRFIPLAQLDLSSDSPPLTPIPNNLLPPVDEEPNTPSSTIVEFGDLGRGSVPSAAQLVENIHRSFSQSRVDFPESRSSSKVRGPHDGRESREGRERREHSRSRSVATPTAPRDRSQSAQRRSNTPKETKTSAASDRGLADDRINRFLQSMAQQAAQTSEADLLQENRSLYQRIAALQRTEREMLAENQDLTRRLSAVKQHHERRARQWNEGLRRKETEYEARMRELGEQLLDLASRNPQKLPGILSNDEISAWFNDQDLCWNRWATTFGHQDGNRLSGSLHPLQLQELCGDVRGFVRMTDAGGLPSELLSGGKEAVHTLLNGMLAHFICAEIITSPMWVFVAASLGTLESPGIVPSKPVPGLPGFRMDMNSFGDVAPLRTEPFQTPRSPQFPPPLVTSMMPSLSTSASFLGLPLKAEMERLVHMLTDAQDDDARVTAHHWRAQMMRLFADGGFSIKDVAAAGRNESRRTFVESRLNYARKLKERFLGGSARFLLQDQDASGIDKLEGMLTDIIDEALRFSSRLWTRMAPVRLHGWRDLGSKEVRATTPLVTLCHAQVEVESRNHRAGASKDKSAGSSQQDSQTDHPMVMAVQPAVITDSINLPGTGAGTKDDGMALVWLKARVMVAGPMSVEIQESSDADAPRQTSPRTDKGGADEPSSTSPSLAKTLHTPRTPQAFEVLPAASFQVSAEPKE